MRFLHKVVVVAVILSCGMAAYAATWMVGLPTMAVTAKPLDKVWATIPEAGGEMAKVGIFEVDSVQGNTATLKDEIGTSYPGIPGALIHPVGNTGKLKINDIALGDSWGASKVIGRVKAIEAGKVTLRYKFGSSISEKQVDFAQPLVSGINPMAWVVYRNTMNSPYKGLVIAKGGGKVWISTDSGHVEVVPEAKVRSLDMAPNGFKVGQTVYGYQWGFGYKPGTVKKIVESYHQYEIKPADKDATQVFIFSEVAAAVP